MQCSRPSRPSSRDVRGRPAYLFLVSRFADSSLFFSLSISGSGSERRPRYLENRPKACVLRLGQICCQPSHPSVHDVLIVSQRKLRCATAQPPRSGRWGRKACVTAAHVLGPRRRLRMVEDFDEQRRPGDANPSLLTASPCLLAPSSTLSNRNRLDTLGLMSWRTFEDKAVCNPSSRRWTCPNQQAWWVELGISEDRLMVAEDRVCVYESDYNHKSGSFNEDF